MKPTARFLSTPMAVALLVLVCVVLTTPAAYGVSTVKAEGTPYRMEMVHMTGDNNLEEVAWANLITEEHNAFYIGERTALYAGGSYPGNVYRKYLDGDSGWEVIGSNLGEAVLDLAEYEGQLYAGTMYPGHPGSVYRYDGGNSWTEVGCFESGEQVSALAVFKGELYAGTSWGGAKLYRYDGPGNWELVWQDDWYVGVRSLCIWGDVLYMGEWEYDSDIIWRWDGGSGPPQKVMEADGNCIWDFEPYADKLYASAWRGCLYGSSDGTNWSTFSNYINGDGGRNIWDVEEFGGCLYAGTDWTGNGPHEGRLYKFDATAPDATVPELVWWEPVVSEHEGIVSMVTDGDYLYLGAGGEAGYYQQVEGTGMVWRYDGTNVEPFSEGVDMRNGIQTLYLAIDATPPSKPSLESPGSGVKVSDTTPTFDWSDVTDPSGVNYSLQVDNNSDFGSPEVNVSGPAVGGYTTAILAEGTYYWRVKAVDGVANESPWSESWSFTVDTTAPLAPTLLSPGSGARTNDNTPSLGWSDVTDPSGVSYSLQVDDDADFSSPIISKEGLTESTYTLAGGEALSDGTYAWRVEVVDGAGNTAGWTDSFSFTVDTTPPPKPSLQSPANGMETSDTTPTFGWSDVSDPSGVSYSLQIDDNADFSSPIISKEGLTGSTYTLTEDEALSNGIYYWRVKAVDGAGNTAGWTDSFSFTIVTLDTTAPPKPSLQSPANGAKTSDITPTFDWSDVTDPSGVSYSLQVDDDVDFSSPVISKEGIVGSTYTLTEDEALSKGTYYWRVKAVDGAGNTAGWTDSFSFTEKKGERGACGCSSKAETSTSELSIGLGIMGFCWGTGFYLVRRANRRRKAKS